MSPLKQKGKKVVKAWAVVHKWKDNKTENCMLEVSFVDCGDLKKPQLKNFGIYSNAYKVVPVTITYHA